MHEMTAVGLLSGWAPVTTDPVKCPLVVSMDIAIDDELKDFVARRKSEINSRDSK